MAILGIVFLLLLAGLVIYMMWFVNKAESDEIIIIDGSVRGDGTTTSQAKITPSFNQPQGIVFSYTGWLLIKDFTKGYGTARRIFSKGDCPGMYLDTTSNGIVVRVKTYGSTETILISNIPASKWIHFAIVVDQEAVDIYINGTLRQHHTLSQIPDLNTEPIITGPNWDGTLGNLSYYARALTPEEIRLKSMQTPPDDLSLKVGKPNYFDITWYIGRLNSTA
jgi:hypothetical protein